MKFFYQDLKCWICSKNEKGKMEIYVNQEAISKDGFKRN